MKAPGSDPLLAIAGLVALGVGAQWVAARVRVPAIVLLLAAGLALGPGFGVLDPEALLGPMLDAFVGLGVAIVLFEGGLSLRWSEARKLGRPLLAMVLGGLVLTFGAATACAHLLVGLSWPVAAVLGAILVVTGPTVIKPMLRGARLTRRPSLLLKWESIVNDPLGALLAVLVLELAVAAAAPEAQSEGLLLRIALLLLLSALIGGLAAWGLVAAMNRGWIPEHLKAPGILAAVVFAFAASDALFHEAGLLTVTVMGVVMANLPSPSVEGIREFKEDLATILVAMLFLLLSAELTRTDVAGVTGGALLFVLAVLFVVRPLFAGLALLGSGLDWREKVFIGWVAPRGVVAVAMGAALGPLLVDAGFEDGARLVPVLFAVVLATVVLHGLTAAPLAQRLGLASRGGGGLMIVGVSGWARSLARTLREQKVDVFLLDDEPRAVFQARLQGLETYLGDPLSEETLDELPFERVGSTLAATEDDSYNAIVCSALQKTIGRERTLQITPAESTEKQSSHLLGTRPWGGGATFRELARRYWSGQTFRASNLTDEYDFEDWRRDAPEALALFVLREGKLAPVAEGAAVGSGKLVHIGPAASAAPPASTGSDSRAREGA